MNLKIISIGLETIVINVFIVPELIQSLSTQINTPDVQIEALNEKFTGINRNSVHSKFHLLRFTLYRDTMVQYIYSASIVVSDRVNTIQNFQITLQISFFINSNLLLVSKIRWRVPKTYQKRK